MSDSILLIDFFLLKISYVEVFKIACNLFCIEVYKVYLYEVIFFYLNKFKKFNF